MSGIFRTNDPNQFDRIDSIIIDEKAPPPSITGVPTNVVIMAGLFERGPNALSLPLGGTGQFFEQYGDNDLFSGNLALKNKRFSALRLIRVLASDAVLASHTLNDGTGGPTNEVYTVQTVADVSGSLNSKFFNFETITAAGNITKRYLWLDVNSAGVDPAPAGRTGHTVALPTNETANNVAAAIQLVLDAITTLGASVVTDTVTATMANPGNVADAVDVDTGFTLATTIQGDGTDVLTFAALFKGAYGNNISVLVEAGSESVGRKYTITDGNANAVLPVEIYDQIIIVGKSQAQINEIFGISKLITATLVGTPAVEPSLVSAVNLTSGSDGTVTDTDYESALVFAEEERAGNLIFLDEYNSARNTQLKVHVSATQDKMTVVCGAENDDVPAVVADVVNFRDSDGRIMYGWPYIETNINNAKVFQNPASWVASIFSQTAAQVSLAFVDTVEFMAGATDLKFKVGRTPFISLNSAGVMGFQFDPDVGIKIRNAVTTHIINSQKRPVLRRRMADFLTDSIALFLKAYDNDVNSVDKQDDIKAAILEFDGRLVRDGILPGEQDVRGGSPLLVDTESANTDDTIAEGKFIILYKRRIFSSMRFIILRAEIGTGVVVTEVA